MSPRSAEFMAEARERLAAARDALAANHEGNAASAAYYAMLYGARAALSERDLYAKTHSGIWSLFSRELVARGSFDPELASAASGSQKIRELGDYEAKPPSPAQAEELLDAAARFIDEVERVLGD